MTLSNAARQTITMVRFDYDDTGTAQYKAYNNGPNTVVHGTFGTFDPLPQLAVEMPEIDGLAEDKQAEILMSDEAPLTTYATGEPFPSVTATIYLADADDPANTAFVIFSGRVTRLLSNADGTPGVLRAYVSGWRYFAKSRLFGLSATTTCPWTFGDRSCLFDVDSLTETGTITAINGLVVTTNIAAGSISETGWVRGSLRRGDLALMIREYTAPTSPDTWSFTLSRKAPSRWLNQQVTLYPGCQKTIDSCRSWNNEERFGGFGIAIPASNPLYGGL